MFFFAAIVSFFYWEVFHRVCVRAVRFRLFALRDKVRMEACKSGLGNSKDYQEVEQFICSTIAYIPDISLLSFVLSARRKIPDAALEEYRRFERDAPKEFVEARRTTARCAMVMMTLNSPWLITCGSLIIPAMLALGQISSARISQNTVSFVGEFGRPQSLPSAANA
jgi:hypothetical protein